MKITTDIPVDQVLIDIHPKTGELIPWQRKKIETDTMAEAHIRITKKFPDFDNRASKLLDCGGYLEFRKYKNGDKTLNRANFCKYRLCPMCSWRRSLKIFGQASQVMDKAKEEKYRFVFVTLTVKNCAPEDLRSTLVALQESATRLHRMKGVKKPVKGWMRVFEVTHNTDRKDPNYGTFHPHIHEIWAVRPSYFGKDYITQADLTEKWQKAANLDYDPICHITAVKTKNKGHIREVAKYSVKPAEILLADHDLTDRAVMVLDSALHRRRLVAWGGILKKIKADLNLDDAENGDLVNVDGDQMNEELDYVLETYSWHAGLKFHMKAR